MATTTPTPENTALPVTQATDVLPADLGTKRLAKFDLLDLDSSLAAAKQLADFIKKRGLSSNIKGKEYVRVEGWQFMFRLAGFSYIVEEPTRLDEDKTIEISRGIGQNARKVMLPVYKYLCKCVITELATNQVVGYGYAICSNEEALHQDYEQYAIFSYAQTRAISKAGRNLFAFIVAAAGYEPTPAEEMEFETAKVVGSTLNNDEALAPPPPAALEQGVSTVPLPSAIPDVPGDEVPAPAKPARKPRKSAAETAAAEVPPAPEALPEPSVADADDEDDADELPAPTPPAPAATTPPPPPAPAAPAAAAEGKTDLTDDIMARMVESVEKKGKKGFDNLVSRLHLYNISNEQYATLSAGVAKYSFMLPPRG